MPVRLAMAGLCIFCAGGLGFLQGQRLRKRICLLKQLARLMEHLERELEFGREPLPQVFYNLSKKNSGSLKVFLQHTAKALQQGDKDIAAVFSENVMAQLSAGALSLEELHELCKMGTELGYPDRQLQMHTVAVYAKELKEHIEELHAQYPKACRVYRTLGTAAGILLAVLLW